VGLAPGPCARRDYVLPQIMKDPRGVRSETLAVLPYFIELWSEPKEITFCRVLWGWERCEEGTLCRQRLAQVLCSTGVCRKK
jgi:hypothetical protein